MCSVCLGNCRFVRCVGQTTVSVLSATDNEASELVAKALGQTRTLAMGIDSPSVKPSPKALQKVNANGK